MKRQVFPIIGTIIAKRSIWENYFFCRLVVGCASAILIVMWPLDLAFMFTL